MPTTYYYIVMSQKEMLQNQILEEILRERANYYLSKNRDFDFWMLISPEFLNKENNLMSFILDTNFFKQHKADILDSHNSQFYSALISLDENFIKWVQLRLGYFELLNKEVGISNSYISDGICGQIKSYEGNNSVLNHNKNRLHPILLSSKLEKSLEIYYSIT